MIKAVIYAPTSISCARVARCNSTQSDQLASPRNLFIFGLGYTGIGLANYFQHKGWSVSGTCRSWDKLENLSARGFSVFQLDTDNDTLNERGLETLHQATHILSTVPPDGLTDPILDTHRELLLSNNASTISWAGYISSSSVYGDHKGAWVDESSPLLASSGSRGYVRKLVEESWLQLGQQSGLPVHVFRCGGIYGPSRSALDAVKKERMKQQKLSSASTSQSQQRRGRQKFTARCHVLDICHVVEASMEQPRAGGGVYNVCDDDPAGRGEVMEYAAQLLGLEGSSGDGGGGRGNDNSSSSNGDNGTDNGSTTTTETSDTSKINITTSTAALEEKRVSNALIKQELGVTLEFPTYREGLRAIAGGDLRPFD